MTETEGTLFSPPLWIQRRAHVSQILLKSHVESVVDIGCGEGDVLQILLNSTAFTRLYGVDILREEIEACYRNCQPTTYDETYLRERPIGLELFVGSFESVDARLFGADAIISCEVIEHLDPPQLESFPAVIFGVYNPPVVVLTTPNAEFNVHFPNLKYGTPDSTFRHHDHKFEWTRQEFELWAFGQAKLYGYSVTISGIGIFSNSAADVGFCTQVATFKRVSQMRVSTAQLPILMSLELFATIQFPYYMAEKEFSDIEVLQEISQQLTNIVYFEVVRSVPEDCAPSEYLSDDEFTDKVCRLWPKPGEFTIDSERIWDVLRVRQMCTNRAKFFKVLGSAKGRQLFHCSCRNDFGPMKVLFAVPLPDLNSADEDILNSPESLESSLNSDTDS